jgi:hypothetical protein
MTWLNGRPALSWEESVVRHGLECELARDRGLLSGVLSEEQRVSVPAGERTITDLTFPCIDRA